MSEVSCEGCPAKSEKSPDGKCSNEQVNGEGIKSSLCNRVLAGVESKIDRMEEWNANGRLQTMPTVLVVKV